MKYICNCAEKNNCIHDFSNYCAWANEIEDTNYRFITSPCVCAADKNHGERVKLVPVESLSKSNEFNEVIDNERIQAIKDSIEHWRKTYAWVRKSTKGSDNEWYLVHKWLMQ